MEKENKKEIQISEGQERCLNYLADIYPDEESRYSYFRDIARETGLDEKKVRVYVRALARKGLAEYTRGLVDYDGMMAGSGYCATFEGAFLVRPCTKCKKEVADESGICCSCNFK